MHELSFCMQQPHYRRGRKGMSGRRREGYLTWGSWSWRGGPNGGLLGTAMFTTSCSYFLFGFSPSLLPLFFIFPVFHFLCPFFLFLTPLYLLLSPSFSFFFLFFSFVSQFCCVSLVPYFFLASVFFYFLFSKPQKKPPSSLTASPIYKQEERVPPALSHRGIGGAGLPYPQLYVG